MRLKGKVAIVTGAAQGLGRGIAIALAREGCRLSLSDVNEAGVRETAEECRRLGREAIASRVDVSKAEDVRRMVEETTGQWGRIDILINNAGVTRVDHITRLKEKDWDLCMNVNLKGTFLCCQAVVPVMIKQKKGKIVNLSSKSGKQGGFWLSAYSASNFGIIGFTQSLALDLALYGINVNAVCPGIIFTPQWDRLAVEYGEKLNIPTEEVKPYYVKKIPMGREGTSEDVAKVIVFLASDDSDYMTGQAINVTGGQEMR